MNFTNLSPKPHESHHIAAEGVTGRSAKKGFRLPLNFSQLLLIVLILMVGALLYIVITPLGFGELIRVKMLTARVARKTTVNTSERPQYAWVTDAEALRSGGEVMQQVYKDAQNGDQILVFSDKMVIYRSKKDQIVYQGPTPQQLQTNLTNQFVVGIIQKAKDARLVSKDSQEVPQLSVVSDPAQIKQVNPSFYQGVQKDDVVVIFAQSQAILIYRPSTQSIVNSGSIRTTISATGSESTVTTTPARPKQPAESPLSQPAQ